MDWKRAGKQGWLHSQDTGLHPPEGLDLSWISRSFARGVPVTPPLHTGATHNIGSWSLHVAQENLLGQKFVVDATLFVDLHKAGKSDNVHDTVSYADVYR